MIDAAGAICVIGGLGGINRTQVYLQDVWVSTDGGARPDYVIGDGGYYGVLRGYERGTRRYSARTKVVLRGYHRYLLCTNARYFGVTRGYFGVPREYSGGS